MSESHELSSEQQQKYETAVEVMREPLKNILDQMKDNLIQGSYAEIIGDDTSGRLPTLVLKKVVDAVYEKEGHKPIRTKFIQGGSFVSPDDKEQQFSLIAADWPKGDTRKALVVTESVESGDAMSIIVEGLETHGISSDVAACYTLYDPKQYKGFSPFEGLTYETNVYAGTRDSSFMKAIYNKQELTGLNPAEFEKIDYEYYLNRGLQPPQPREPQVSVIRGEDRSKMLAARRDVDRLSQELIEYVYASKNEGALVSQ